MASPASTVAEFISFLQGKTAEVYAAIDIAGAGNFSILHQFGGARPYSFFVLIAVSF